MDFVYQVSNNAGSTDSIARLTATNFSGWDTDVGYATNGSALGSSFVDGTWAPETVDRVTPGDTIGFSFTPTVIVPGDSSTVLIIETNATTYSAGDLNIIDGGVSTVDAYEPGLSATPLPAALPLFAGGLGMFGFISRRKKRNAEKALAAA